MERKLYFHRKQEIILGLPMLLFINEIDFKAFGPFNDVDGTDVKLFRAMFKSYKPKKKREEKKNAFQLIKLKWTFFSAKKNK